jgi:PadR family transcriptional regulator, regulatory protein PadR
MRSASLGEFEHLLLLTVLRLGADAYGLEIARELASRADRRISRGALYSSLDRLEQKGLLRWKETEGSARRDHLPRRLYALTASGVAALRESREVLRRMWRGIEPLLKDPTT